MFVYEAQQEMFNAMITSIGASENAENVYAFKLAANDKDDKLLMVHDNENPGGATACAIGEEQNKQITEYEETLAVRLDDHLLP